MTPEQQQRVEKLVPVANKLVKQIAAYRKLNDLDRDDLLSDAYLKIIQLVQRYDEDEWWEAKLQVALRHWKTDYHNRSWSEPTVPLNHLRDYIDPRQSEPQLGFLEETSCPHIEFVRRLATGEVAHRDFTKYEQKMWYTVFRGEVQTYLENLYGYRHGERPSHRLVREDHQQTEPAHDDR